MAVGVASGAAAYLLGVSIPWSVAIGFVAPATARRRTTVPVGHRQRRIHPESPRGDRGVGHVGHGVRRPRRADRPVCGVPVIMTAVTGDWGVDLIVGNRPDRVAVQCKRQSRPVGAGAVQEVVAGAPMHDCTKTMVVTNHEFTPAAVKLAELHGCELVGGSELPRLRSIVRRLTEPSAPTAALAAARPARRRRRRRSRATTPSAQAGTGRCRVRWPA